MSIDTGLFHKENIAEEILTSFMFVYDLRKHYKAENYLIYLKLSLKKKNLKKKTQNLKKKQKILKKAVFWRICRTLAKREWKFHSVFDKVGSPQKM